MMGLRVANIKVFSANALESKCLRFQASLSTAACRGSLWRMLPGCMQSGEILMVSIAIAAMLCFQARLVANKIGCPSRNMAVERK